MSAREPSIQGMPGKPTPIQIKEYVDGTIKRHMQDALEPQDKLVMEAANRKLMIHATTGLWIGSTCGALLAFRSRFMAGRRAAALAAKGGATPSVPKLFYPPTGGAQAGAGAPAGAAAGSRFGFIARGLGLGMLGALMGTQIGVWTGTSGAQKIIRESGQEERIARSLKLAMERATAEIRANSEGIDVKNPLMMAGKAASPYGDLGTDNFDDSAAAPSHRDEQPSSSPSPREPETASLNDTEATTSRWDELRKSRPTSPSTWDAVRERSSRSDVPPPSINRGDQAPRPNEGGGAVDEKELKRRQFEEAMAREREGKDDGFSEGKWK